jgi:hypothetical protein
MENIKNTLFINVRATGSQETSNRNLIEIINLIVEFQNSNKDKRMIC